VILEVESPSGGLVVLHDAYDKGWRARLDGRPVEILPVNLISRGVVVGPGRHRIEMVYEPPAFCIGAGISAAAILSMGITAVTVRRRRRLFGATRGGITSSRAALRGYRA
jgi:uncharacterized membrane protein YfhO